MSSAIYEWDPHRQVHTLNGQIVRTLPNSALVHLYGRVIVNPHQTRKITKDEIDYRDPVWGACMIELTDVTEYIYILDRQFVEKDLRELHHLNKNGDDIRYVSLKEAPGLLYLVHHMKYPSWMGTDRIYKSWAVYYNYGVLSRTTYGGPGRPIEATVYTQRSGVNPYTHKRESAMTYHIGNETTWFLPPMFRPGLRACVPEYVTMSSNITSRASQFRSRVPDRLHDECTKAGILVPIELLLIIDDRTQEEIQHNLAYLGAYDYHLQPDNDPVDNQNHLHDRIWKEFEYINQFHQNGTHAFVNRPLSTRNEYLTGKGKETQNWDVGGFMRSILNQLTKPKPLFLIDDTIDMESIDYDTRNHQFRDHIDQQKGWLDIDHPFVMDGYWRNNVTGVIVHTKEQTEDGVRQLTDMVIGKTSSEWSFMSSVIWQGGIQISDYAHNVVYGHGRDHPLTEWSAQLRVLYPNERDDEVAQLHEDGVDMSSISDQLKHRETAILTYYNRWLQRIEHNLVYCYAQMETNRQIKTIQDAREVEFYANRDQSKITPMGTSMDTTGAGKGKRRADENEYQSFQDILQAQSEEFKVSNPGVKMFTAGDFDYYWVNKQDVGSKRWAQEVHKYLVEYEDNAYGKDLGSEVISDTMVEPEVDFLVRQYKATRRTRGASVELYGSAVLGTDREKNGIGIYVLMAKKGGGRHLMDEIVRYMKQNRPKLDYLLLFSVDIPGTLNFYWKYGFGSQFDDVPTSRYMKYPLSDKAKAIPLIKPGTITTEAPKKAKKRIKKTGVRDGKRGRKPAESSSSDSSSSSSSSEDEKEEKKQPKPRTKYIKRDSKWNISEVSHLVPYSWEKPYDQGDMQEKVDRAEQLNLNPTQNYGTREVARILTRWGRNQKPYHLGPGDIQLPIPFPKMLPNLTRKVQGTTYRSYVGTSYPPGQFRSVDTMWFYNTTQQNFITHLLDIVEDATVLADHSEFPADSEHVDLIKPCMHFVCDHDGDRKNFILRDRLDNSVFATIPLPPPLVVLGNITCIEVPRLLYAVMAISSLRWETDLIHASYQDIDSGSIGRLSINTNAIAIDQENIHKRFYLRHGMQQDGTSVYLFGYRVKDTQPIYRSLFEVLSRPYSPLGYNPSTIVVEPPLSPLPEPEPEPERSLTPLPQTQPRPRSLSPLPDINQSELNNPSEDDILLALTNAGPQTVYNNNNNNDDWEDLQDEKKNDPSISRRTGLETPVITFAEIEEIMYTPQHQQYHADLLDQQEEHDLLAALSQQTLELEQDAAFSRNHRDALL